MSAFALESNGGIYSPSNAHRLARMAALAYTNASEIETAAGALGLTRFQFFDGRRTDTQAFVAGNEQDIIVAFRGTQPLEAQDWLTDAKFRLVDGIHRGFREAFDEVWGDMARFIQSLKGPRIGFAEAPMARNLTASPSVWFTGHSLGAALATLAAARMRSEDQPVAGLYTYGQPRTGSRDWARWFNEQLGARTYRFVNNSDLVTRVPLRAMSYSHVGNFRYFDADGEYHDDLSLWERFLDRVHGRIEDFLELGPDALKDHSIDAYLALLERHSTQADR